MNQELRPFFFKFFGFNWKFGLFLILILCVPRFYLVLNANETGNYSLIGLVMVISAIVPFVFLSKYGRKQIGLRRPNSILWTIVALFVGLVASLILYFLGVSLYGVTMDNWYVYIGKSYQIPNVISETEKWNMFLMMAGAGMVFSPAGEELFFRGVVHASFAKSMGDRKAALIDSSTFALVHISHFGLIFLNDSWSFVLVPMCIWVMGMFLCSLLFFVYKKKTGSILAAILCHAGFNLGMIYCIFYML